MKTLRCLTQLTAITLFAAGLAYGDTSTFTIHVNPHAGLPAARVLFTLELSAAAGASTLSSGGSSTAVPGVIVLGNTDQITAVAPTVAMGDPNRIDIEYLPNSILANNCTLKMGQTGAVDVTMTLTTPGGVSITAYRINTYTSPSSSPCTDPRRRISANEATVSFSTTALTNKGRHPLDVILVLDESGSMASVPPGAMGGPSRWSILASAVNAFVNKWEVADAPSGSGEWSEDRLGLVFFTTNSTANLFSGNFFLRRGTNPPGMTHNWAAVAPVMAMHGPTAWTALGKGIDTALDQWEPLTPDTTKNDASFVVLTDGMQNVAPLVSNLDGTIIQALEPTGGGAPKELYLHGIPMQTIAFGTPATTEVDLLSRIGLQTGGLALQTVDQFTVYDNFADTLVSILKGGTLSLIRRERAMLAEGVRLGQLFPVEVDGTVRRAMFSAEWIGGRGLTLQVFPPGATPGPNDTGLTPTQQVDSFDSTVEGFDVPAVAPPGIWQVRIARKLTSSGPQVQYNLSAHMVEGRLKYRLTFDKADAGTGDHVGIRAEVAFDGKPLDSLPTNAIQVHISRPPEGLGNILHDTVVAIPPPGGGDTSTPYDRKVDALVAGGSLLSRINPAPVSTISLGGQGEGIYTGSFSNTSVPGAYHFDVTLDWTDARTGHIHRVEKLERQVKVNADPGATSITATPLGGGSYEITVIPRDRFNNYVGPGHGQLIIATPVTGTLAGPPTDANEIGVYKFRLNGVQAGQPAIVNFVVDGNSVGSSGITPPPTSPTRFFLDIGPNFPQGSFSNGANGMWSLNAGIERFLAPLWSVEGILGYHAFDVQGVSNSHIWQLSAGGKRYFGTAPWHPFVDVSAGIYRIDPNGSTKFGGNAGLGVLYDVSSRWGLEGVYQFHTISTSSTTNFSALQVGVRVQF